MLGVNCSLNWEAVVQAARGFNAFSRAFVKTFYSVTRGGVLALLLLSGTVTVCAAASTYDKFSLADAELVALKNDLVTAKTEAEQNSLREQAVAAYSWPDPKINVGIVNMPAISLDFEQEPMTQAVVGISQAFPPRGGVGAKRDQLQSMADAMGHAVKNRHLLTQMAVRKSWLNVYQRYQSLRLIEESLAMFKQLISVTEFQYRAGRGNQQDVIRAQLEESLLIDQQADMEAKYEVALAGLRRWLGVRQIAKELDMRFPDLVKPLSTAKITSRLENHPSMLMYKARVAAAENGVNYASAQLNPGWMVKVQYGLRGAGRDDFLTGMLSFDVPLFTEKRQDRVLLARKSDLIATQRNLDDWRRELRQRQEGSAAVYSRANERVELYRSTVLPQSQQNIGATLKAYQSGVTDFNVLVRARLTELKSQLQFIKLNVERANAQVELLYLAGV
ncbi:MAG: TolC family protein [Gammaproteobacteria bacterium]|nr:TolC family protein [Gammaproteobacteria bacterium]